MLELRVSAALVCAIVLASCGGASANQEPAWERPGLGGAVRPEMGPPQPGDAAPTFELPRPDGTPFRLADARAPPHAQPALEDRAQAVFDSSLIIDPRGRIRLFLLPDSAHFDPSFGALRRELDQMLAADEPRRAASARHSEGRPCGFFDA